jgi:hypothetical protein
MSVTPSGFIGLNNVAITDKFPLCRETKQVHLPAALAFPRKIRISALFKTPGQSAGG